MQAIMACLNWAADYFLQCESLAEHRAFQLAPFSSAERSSVSRIAPKAVTATADLGVQRVRY